MQTLELKHVINAFCPWSGEAVRDGSLTHYRGAVVGFCNPVWRADGGGTYREVHGVVSLTMFSTADWFCDQAPRYSRISVKTALNIGSVRRPVLVL